MGAPDLLPLADQVATLLNNWAVNAVLASGIVGRFYWSRFNSMRGTRSYTTAAMYYIGLVCFILPFVGIYALLITFSVPQIPAICLLMVAWLLPRLPEAWRKTCHSIAAIPAYAYRFKERLATTPFALRNEDEPVVRRKLARCGYDFKDFVAAQATGIQARLVKMAAIMHHLEMWEQEYPIFMHRNEETYHALQEAFDLLTFKIIRAIKSVTKINAAIAAQRNQSNVLVDDWNDLDLLATHPEPIHRVQSVIQAAMGGSLEDLRKDIDFFLDRLLLLVTRGVLANENRFERRRQKLEMMGFTVDTRPPSSLPAAVNAIVITVLCSTVWFFAIGEGLIGGNLRANYTKVIFLTLFIIGCNFYVVYYFRRNFAFANLSASGKKPLLFISTVGLVTALSVVPFRLVLDWYTKTLISGYANVVYGYFVLSLVPWLVGTLTAWLAQESTWLSIDSRRVKRALDGAVYGGGLAASVLLLWAINRKLSVHIGVLDKMSPNQLLGTIGIFSAIYAVIGYLVLARFRDALSLREPISRGVRTSTVFEVP